jgi:hypothetical protein
MQATLKTFVGFPWVEAVASVPFLVTLCLLGGLQAVDRSGDAIWIRRLWRVSWALGFVFVALVAARFALLSF